MDHEKKLTDAEKIERMSALLGEIAEGIRDMRRRRVPLEDDGQWLVDVMRRANTLTEVSE